MIILINKKRAVLKKGTSFDFISETHYFTGADSYTLSITFPIKGCTENIAIFGHIYRKDKQLTNDEIKHYQKMVMALTKQIEVMTEVDKNIVL